MTPRDLDELQEEVSRMPNYAKVYDGPHNPLDAETCICVDTFLLPNTVIEVSTQRAQDGSYSTDVVRIRGAGLNQVVIFAKRDQVVRLRSCLDDYLLMVERTPDEAAVAALDEDAEERLPWLHEPQLDEDEAEAFAS